jgi:hypothetical protein
MADDFDNTDEIRNLSDDELLRLVRQELGSQKGFDIDDLELSVADGAVTVSGRVGTEEELRIVDHVLTDVIGVAGVTNNLVVDEIRRATSPEAIDEHLADEEEHGGLLLGDIPRPFSPEAEHLADVSPDDSMGTHDVQDSIENAEPWIPPESPTPEGLGGSDQGRLGADSEH